MIIVFTDLDGTLLDHNTYSYEEAGDGLDLLRKRTIPLVLVSSKTLSEMKILHRELGLDSPIIFENGGGIAYPVKGNDDFDIEILGSGADELKRHKKVIEDEIGCEIKILKEMGIEEIVSLTGLSREKAALSKERLASMPFVAEGHSMIGINELNKINVEMERHSIILTKGGRFFHCLSKASNKGVAIKRVISYYKKMLNPSRIISIGIGDSENDVPMLESVDIPYLVRKSDSSFIYTGLDNIKTTSGIGPAGFSEAIFNEVG